MKITFPSDFWWGAATSGPQSEGAANIDGRKDSIWDFWFKKEPTRFHNNIGPERASNFYYQYKEDIALLKELKQNSFRTSIQWSRLIPNGIGEVNQEAVKFYNSVIDELINNNIEPFINLYHFDMPMSMQEIGGWESRDVVNAYVDYAKLCFDLFGDRVKYWFTFNEPIVPVEGGYLYDFHYPNIIDFRRASQVAHNIIIAHALAVKSYREKKLGGKISVILNLTPSYSRSNKKEDLEAAKISDLFFNRSFLDPMVLGEYPNDLIELLKKYEMLPEIIEGDLEIIKNNTVDFLGVNYYCPKRVKVKESECSNEFKIENFFDNYEPPNRKMNPYRGWEIYEKAIYDILINLKLNYNNIDVFISENGMGVEDEAKFRNDKGYIEDDYRIEFIKNHLQWIKKALEEGSHCKGYHLWTWVDCWSWTNAYKNRYGYIELDLENGFKRIIKKSGYWIKDVVQNNGFEI